MKETDPRRVRTVAELQGILGVGRATAYKMVATGEIRSFRILNNKIRIDDDEVERYLREGPQPASGAHAARAHHLPRRSRHANPSTGTEKAGSR